MFPYHVPVVYHILDKESPEVSAGEVLSLFVSVVPQATTSTKCMEQTVAGSPCLKYTNVHLSLHSSSSFDQYMYFRPNLTALTPSTGRPLVSVQPSSKFLYIRPVTVHTSSTSVYLPDTSVGELQHSCCWPSNRHHISCIGTH